MIALVVFTDGRDECLGRTLMSARDHLKGPITRRIVVHDGPAPPANVTHMIDALLGDRALHIAHRQRLGFGGTIAAAWRWVDEYVREPFVFHLEDDFVFNRDVDLNTMARVLDRYPYLVQLALRRQPWNDEERAAGGIVELHPEAYTDREVDTWTDPSWPGELPERAVRWLEHRLFFTTNPSLYRRDLCELGWPVEDRSEGKFTHRLLEADDVRFGFWGARDSGEWVEHIGNERVGTGY